MARKTTTPKATATTATAVLEPGHGNIEDSDYQKFLQRFQQEFAAIDAPLFTTDINVDYLWDRYIQSFPAPERQYHNCNSCRRFIQTFGTLVVIDPESGALRSAFWHPFNELGVGLHHEYKAIESLRSAIEDQRGVHDKHAGVVSKVKVTGVFLSSEKVWGNPQNVSQRTGARWAHLHINNPRPFTPPARKTADQVEAERREDYKNVLRALKEYPKEIVDQAVALLKTDTLFRVEKVIGQAKWFQSVHEMWSTKKGLVRDNLLWLAVAKAPAGFCHPRSSMIGTLLDDLVAKMEIGAVTQRFRQKMDPLQYQRPQAPPKAGAILEAEKLFAELGAEKSLHRRFARFDEIEKLWVPRVSPPKTHNGIFGHLSPNEPKVKAMEAVSSIPITWEKFRRLVMPEALTIDVMVPYHGQFVAYTTAVHPDAPPILQWDAPQVPGLPGWATSRNPVSYYSYNVLTRAHQWCLESGSWVSVTGLAAPPHRWQMGELEQPEVVQRMFDHHGDGVLFILQGCKDSAVLSDFCSNGNALFPEMLKADFRPVRSVIEAYSKKERLHGYEEASACGLYLGSKSSIKNLQVRVKTSDTLSTIYVLDRWD